MEKQMSPIADGDLNTPPSEMDRAHRQETRGDILKLPGTISQQRNGHLATTSSVNSRAHILLKVTGNPHQVDHILGHKIYTRRFKIEII